ncbi:MULTISPECIES: MspA family porin [Gordonia]|uniref:MspA family porin n=1 Tax=Gordonia TaxID=2053 RepID=UPI0024552650|nr:MspA family porin [Gordonia sp. SMJS1]WGJ86833.1 MspA family porin [Gordonia sp. SMJS1]
MSKFSKLGLRRAAGAVAIASAAVVGLAGAGAGEAAAGKLADGYKKAVGIDGESIQTWRTGEFALPAPSVANNGAGRSGVVSGVYQAQASEGVEGNLAVKLLVGCQVDIGDVELGAAIAFDLESVSVDGAFSIGLKPGQVAVVNVTDKDFSDAGKAAVQLSRFEVSVQKCGGFASARTAVKVIGAKGFSTDDGTVSGEGTLIQSTLYGQPFSLN